MSAEHDAWMLKASRTILSILVSADMPLGANALCPVAPRDATGQNRRYALLSHLVNIGVVNVTEARRGRALYVLKPVALHRVEDVLAQPGDAELGRALWPAPTDVLASVPVVPEHEPVLEPVLETVDVMAALADRLGLFIDVLERVDARLTKLEDTVAHVRAEVLQEGFNTRAAFEESEQVDIEPTHKVALDTRTLAGTVHRQIADLAKRPALDVAGLGSMLNVLVETIGVRVRTTLDEYNAERDTERDTEAVEGIAAALQRGLETSFDSLAKGMEKRDRAFFQLLRERDEDSMKSMETVARVLASWAARGDYNEARALPALGTRRTTMPNLGVLSALAPVGEVRQVQLSTETKKR